MTRKGTLSIVMSVSRLMNWRRLARSGADDPLGAATDFLAEKGFDDGDKIQVTGTLGELDNGILVCFITDAQAA